MASSSKENGTKTSIHAKETEAGKKTDTNEPIEELPFEPVDFETRAAELGLPSDMPRLHVAAWMGELDVIKELAQAEGFNVDARDPDGNTALHMASIQGHVEVMKWFLENGADVMARGLNDYTALHYLVASPHTTGEAVRVLLTAGASPSATALNMLSPCTLAIESRQLEILNTLLGHQENGQPYDLRLHVAAMSGDRNVVKAVLKSGVDANCRDPGNSTPIHVACVHDQEETFLELLAAGADITLLGQHSLTAAHMCALNGSLKCLSLIAKSHPTQLIAHDPLKFSPLHLAAQGNQPKVIDILVRHGADVNEYAGNELAPLHMAAMNGNDAFISELLTGSARKAVKVSMPAIDGITALHCAAMAGKESTLKLLVESGADINAKTELGQTALEFAQMSLYQADARLDPLEAELRDAVDTFEKGNAPRKPRDDQERKPREVDPNKSIAEAGGEDVQDMQPPVEDLERCCAYLESLALENFSKITGRLVDPDKPRPKTGGPRPGMPKAAPGEMPPGAEMFTAGLPLPSGRSPFGTSVSAEEMFGADVFGGDMPGAGGRAPGSDGARKKGPGGGPAKQTRGSSNKKR